jgi:serine/threonine protein kinase
MSSFKPYKLGHGISGLVYRVSLTRVIKSPWDGRSHHIAHERKIFDRLGRHPLIVQSFNTQQKYQISLEYHPQNLRELLKTGGSAHSPRWLHQITEAIIYLHSKDVIHRDLSPRNILITVQGNVVLCDFASSSLDGNWPADCAGEVRFCRHVNDKASIRDDIFALGCVFYEILVSTPPYAEKEDHEVRTLYESGIFPTVDHLPIGDVIMNCWTDRYETAMQVLHDLVGTHYIIHLRTKRADLNYRSKKRHLSNIATGCMEPLCFISCSIFSMPASDTLNGG